MSPKHAAMMYVRRRVWAEPSPLRKLHSAVIKIVTGIKNSTHFPGTRNKSSDATASVRLCPTVKAVARSAALPA